MDYRSMEVPADVRAGYEAAARQSALEREERGRVREMQRKAEEAEEQRQEALAAESRAAAQAELAKEAEELEAAAKERARREYPFTAESFEEAWPTIRATLAAQEAARCRANIAMPRDYMSGGIGGGRTEPSSTFGPIDR
jgi:hypothetical protein